MLSPLGDLLFSPLFFFSIPSRCQFHVGKVLALCNLTINETYNVIENLLTLRNNEMDQLWLLNVENSCVKVKQTTDNY